MVETGVEPVSIIMIIPAPLSTNFSPFISLEDYLRSNIIIPKTLYQGFCKILNFNIYKNKLYIKK